MGATGDGKRAAGRSLADFWLGGVAGALHPAEQALLETCRKGDWAIVADARPEGPGPDNFVRAAFVRFLALGGDADAPVHEHGVQLQGGWIDGLLDFNGCERVGWLALQRCRIDRVEALDAGMKRLDLSGSCLDGGLVGDGLRCTGNIFLSDGFHATGAVRLVDAMIDGNLGCSGGRFDNATGDALSCDRAEISGGLFFRGVAAVEGRIDLSVARVAILVDDAASWGKAREVVLDGFVYTRIAGTGAATDADTRIKWLKQQPHDHLGREDFRPQPWEQLIGVLRAMGHPNAARDVAIAKQQALRDAGRARSAKRPFASAFHWLYGQLAGFGYRPTRLFTIMVVTWAGIAGIDWRASDLFSPAKPAADQVAPAQAAAPPAADASAPVFDAAFYSLDALLPIDLGYQSRWKTDDDTLGGQLLRWLAGAETIFGWIASLLLVGVLGNLIKKD